MSDSKKQETGIVKTEAGEIVQYGDWTPEQIKEEDKEMSSGGEFWKPQVGRQLVRFLPPLPGWKGPFTIQHQHFINMPGVEHKIIFTCPKQHKNKPCVACARADKLETAGNSKDTKQAKKLRAQRRVGANVIVTPKDPTSKVSIWWFGKRVYGQLKGFREDVENGGNFLDPLKGYDISVTRVGTGKDDTVYTLVLARNQTQLLNMGWITAQTDLRKFIRIPTVEQQKRLLDGEDPRDVWNDGNEPQRPAASSDLDDDLDGTPVKGSGRTAEDDLYDDEVDLD